MWGKLNLPMFLFNVGLLTLIKLDSLTQTWDGSTVNIQGLEKISIKGLQL